MTRIGVRTLVALAALLATGKLLAFPSSRLVYARGDGAESCPAEAAARRAVAVRLGYDPFFPSADKTVIAEIVRDRGELRGRVAMVDEQGLIQGAREFRTKVALCDELVATMALAISIAIDPTQETAAIPTAPVIDSDSSAVQSAPPAAQDSTARASAKPASAVQPRSRDRERGEVVLHRASESPARSGTPAADHARLEARAGCSPTSHRSSSGSTQTGYGKLRPPRHWSEPVCW